MVWGMPAVNLDLMCRAMLREAKAQANQMLDWSRLLDWRNQTLTPNTDVIYLTPYFDTKEVGPVVLEIPPGDDGSPAVATSLPLCPWSPQAAQSVCRRGL